jgi:hypothetical protein
LIPAAYHREIFHKVLAQQNMVGQSYGDVSRAANGSPPVVFGELMEKTFAIACIAASFAARPVRRARTAGQ